LDDFGTGYCSLGHFERLPIDIIKIDRRFVSTLTFQTARSSLAAVIVGMCRALEVECVAEGVETVEQEQALRLLGCTLAQGYLFGRPVPLAQFTQQYLGGPS
jgi:EAL domain-containing protein (putative c-di-GMP-specific phosphodiesterase class I)